MSAFALNVPVNFEEVNCGECGGIYAINARYHSQKREKGGGWTCPYCKTSWGFFGKTPVEKAREELEAEKQRHRATLARVNEAEAVAEKLRKDAARAKKRAHAGLCPCCNRTFVNLQRHMATKHAEVAT